MRGAVSGASRGAAQAGWRVGQGRAPGSGARRGCGGVVLASRRAGAVGLRQGTSGPPIAAGPRRGCGGGSTRGPLGGMSTALD